MSEAKGRATIELKIQGVVLDDPLNVVHMTIGEMRHFGRRVRLMTTPTRDWVWVESDGHKTIAIEVAALLAMLAEAQPPKKKGGRK